MFCTNCGSEMPEDAVFCSNCGKAVNDTPKENAATTIQPQAGEKNTALTGLVLGIVTIIVGPFAANFFAFTAFVPVMTGIAGIIVSAAALSRNKKAGQPIRMAIWGLILSIIGLVLTIYGFISAIF